MKNLFSLLIIALLAFTACTKNKIAPEIPASPVKTDTPVVNRPVSQAPSNMVITDISPATGSTGTEVTITGSGFGNMPDMLEFYLAGINQATIKSVSPTKIVATVGGGITGTTILRIKSSAIAVQGPMFRYVDNTPSVLKEPYFTGNVILTNQQMVNDFVAANKNRKIDITGDLSITGADINDLAGMELVRSVSGDVTLNYYNTNAEFLSSLSAAANISITNTNIETLNLNELKNFKGSLYLSNLSKLSSLSIGNITELAGLNINGSPLLKDLSAFENVNVWGYMTVRRTGITELKMNNIKSLTSEVYIAGNINLTELSLTGLTSCGLFTIDANNKLSTLRLGSLKSVTSKLSIRSSALTTMEMFNTLRSAGSLMIVNNDAITSLEGFNGLTALSDPAGTMGNIYMSDQFGGLAISSNEKLTSLKGLEQLQSAVIVRIALNPSLNTFCEVKGLLEKQAVAPSHQVRRIMMTLNNQLSQYQTVAALSMSNNGTRLTKANALESLSSCR